MWVWFISRAFAATTVCVDPVDTACFATITEALADKPDEIIVHAGSYAESFAISRNVAIYGDGMDLVTISGSIAVDAGLVVAISGASFVPPSDADMITVGTGASLAMVDVVLGDSVTPGGALIRAKLADIYLENATITAVTQYGVAPLTGTTSNWWLRRCVLTDNTVAAVIVTDGVGLVDLVETEISGNSTYYGALVSTKADVSLTSDFFFINTAILGGGAVLVKSASLLVNDSYFYQNSNGLYGAGAIGVSPEGAVVTAEVNGSVFEGNTAPTSGAGAIVFADGTMAVVRSSYFFANRGAWGPGALYSSASAVEVRNSVFMDNWSDLAGGAVFSSGDALTMVNNTFVGNGAASTGGTIYLTNSTTTLFNNAFVGTRAFFGLYAENGTTDVQYCSWYDNRGGDISGSPSAPAHGADDVFGEPRFYAYSDNGLYNDDGLWLGFESPLIDAGDPSISDPDGSRSDIGAYGGEAAPAVLFTDADGDGAMLSVDCDDENPLVRPGIPEVCNGYDDDCDYATDEDDDDVVLTRWSWDADADGWGDEGDARGVIIGCPDPGASWVDTAGDCVPSDAGIHPTAPEGCDGIDTDCDRDIPLVELDGDADGFRACEGDCDDGDTTIAPNLFDNCDGRDENCSGVADDGDEDLDGVGVCDDCDDKDAAAAAPADFWPDLDGDGHGDASAELVSACGQPEASSLDNLDCDDGDARLILECVGWPGGGKRCGCASAGGAGWAVLLVAAAIVRRRR